MKKRIFLTILLTLLTFALYCAVLTVRQQALAGKLIRFHVVAASDSANDQALKLEVRDALLTYLRPLGTQAQSREEMAQFLRRDASALKARAEAVLRGRGCADTVEVTLAPEPFPTRYYSTFALPAGTYLALRVRIGRAEGHNWWCVCFPSLCESACTQDLSAAAAGAGFTGDEIDWITDTDRYELRFKVLQWLSALRS